MYREKIANSIFSKLNMTEEDAKFVVNISEADNMEHNIAFLQKKTALSIFFLAKELEASSKSSNINSTRMFWLTLIIGLFGLVQIVDLILKIIKII